MAGDLNLSLKITALVDGVEKIRELARAVTDASKGTDAGPQKAVTDLGKAAADTSTKVKDLGAATKGANDAAKDVPRDFGNAVNAVAALTSSVNLLTKGFGFLAGGFLAIKGVSFIKDIADTAARTETLGVVLRQTGVNAGYTAQQLADADKSVQALGVTAAASRESLTQLIKAGLDLSYGPKFARAAQDLAVVAGQNSSETLSRLITNVQQMDTQGLKFMGIVLDREKVLNDAAKDVNGTLSKTAERLAFANAVLAESTKLNGIYEESMNSVGKQLTSIPRYIENLKVALGNNLLPVYLAVVKGTISILDSFNKLGNAFNATAGGVDRLHSSLDPAQEGFSGLALAVDKTAKAIAGFVTFLAENVETLKTVAFYLSAVAAGFVAIEVAVAGGAALTGFITLLGSIAAVIPAIILAIKGFAAAAVLAGAATAFALGPVVLVVGAIVVALGAAAAAWAYFTGKGKEAAKQQSDQLAQTKTDVDAYTASLDKQAALRGQITTASREGLTLLNKLADAESKGNATNIASAKAAVKAQSDKVAALNAQLKVEGDLGKAALAKLDQAQKEGKITEEQYKQIDAAKARAAAVQKAIELERQAQENLENALKNAGIDLAQFLFGVDSKFRDTVGGIIEGSKDIGLKGQDAAVGITAMTDALIKLAEQTKTPEELKKFAEALAAVRTASQQAIDNGAKPSSVLSAKTAEAIAAEAKRNSDKAERERAAGGAKALAEANAMADALQAAIVSRAQSILDITKAANQRLLAENESAYTRGLIGTKDYYEEKLRVATLENQKELDVQQATLKELQSKAARATDPAARTSARTAVAAQENKLFVTQITQQNELQAIKNERLLKQEELQRSIVDLQLKNRVSENSADLAAQLGIIQRAYEDQVRTLHVVKDSEQDLALKREAQGKAQAAVLAAENLALQRQADLVNAQIENQQSRLDLAQKQGTVSVTEAQNANNDLIAQRIAAQQAQRNAVAAQLTREQDQVSSGFGGNSDAVVALQAKLRELDNSMLNLAASTQTYGDSIRVNFTENLASGLDDILLKGKTAADFLKGLANSLRQQITSIITKDFASNATKFLVENTGGAGNSIFDKLGQSLGDKARGTTPSTPMYVQDVSKIGAGLGGKGKLGEGADATSLLPDLVDSDKAGGGIFGQIKSKITDAATSFGDFLSGSLSSLGGSLSSVFSSAISSLSDLFSSSSGGGGGSWLSTIFSFFGSAQGGLMNGSRTAHNTISRPLASLAMALPLAAFAGGGNVKGHGTGTSDSILSWLSNGEFVVKAASVAAWGTDFMNFINAGPAGPTAPAYAEGGMAGEKVMGLLRDSTSTGGTGAGGTKIDKLVNNIDSRTDTGQVMQLISQGVRQGIQEYDKGLRAKGKIR